MDKIETNVDWAAVRQKFPAAETYVYLNTGGGGCMSVEVAEVAKQYYDDSVVHADLKWREWLGQVEATRQKIATSWLAEVDEIGFVGSLSVAMNAAALMFRDHGGEVLAMADEFPSVTIPWLNLGYSVRFVDSDADGRIPVERIADSITAETRYLLTSSVQYRTGMQQDLAALGRLCAERDLLLIVDATQSFGVFPIDVQACNIAFLSASVYKWTTAGYGVAPFYVRRALLEEYGLPLAGYQSNVDPNMMLNNSREFRMMAKAVEAGHPPIPGILALGAALDLFAEIGEVAIAERVLALTQYLHQQLDAAGLPIVSAREVDLLSGITMVGVGERDNEVVAAALREQNIFVSPRGGKLRVAVHLYNNEADVDAFVAALSDVC